MGKSNAARATDDASFDDASFDASFDGWTVSLNETTI